MSTTCETCGSDLTHGRRFCSPACYFCSTKRARIPPQIRFWRWVTKTETCWLWTGRLDTNGRGRLRITTGYKQSKTVLASRLSWELHSGEIPLDMVVCHHCDNPACVRQDHLFLGTQQDNVRDMVEKKRLALGERRGGAKMTATKVRIIRTLGETHSLSEIGRAFGINGSTVWAILHRQTWRHID